MLSEGAISPRQLCWKQGGPDIATSLLKQGLFLSRISIWPYGLSSAFPHATALRGAAHELITFFCGRGLQ